MIGKTVSNKATADARGEVIVACPPGPLPEGGKPQPSIGGNRCHPLSVASGSPWFGGGGGSRTVQHLLLTRLRFRNLSNSRGHAPFATGIFYGRRLYYCCIIARRVFLGLT